MSKENRNTPSKGVEWAQKLLWVVIGASLSLVVALVVGILQSRSPELYYIVDSPTCHELSGERYVFGSIELGNDGNKEIKDWAAIIDIPGTKPSGIDISPKPQSCQMEATKSGTRLQFECQENEDVLNAGDRYIIKYRADKQGDAKVRFKGPGSTARERQSQASDKASDTSLYFALIALTLAVLTLGLENCHAYLKRRRLRRVEEQMQDLLQKNNRSQMQREREMVDVRRDLEEAKSLLQSIEFQAERTDESLPPATLARIDKARKIIHGSEDDS